MLNESLSACCGRGSPRRGQGRLQSVVPLGICTPLCCTLTALARLWITVFPTHCYSTSSTGTVCVRYCYGAPPSFCCLALLPCVKYQLGWIVLYSEQ